MSFKNYKYTPLENMTLNIILEGQGDVWKSIELEKDAFKRFRQRALYAKALIDLGR